MGIGVLPFYPPIFQGSFALPGSIQHLGEQVASEIGLGRGIEKGANPSGSDYNLDDAFGGRADAYSD